MNRVITIVTTGAVITLALVATIVGYMVLTHLQPEVLLVGRISLYALAVGVISAVTISLYWLYAWIRAGTHSRQVHIDEHRAQVRKLNAEAAVIEREAHIWVTDVPPGHQVYQHELSPSTYTTPLHLQPGRVNGEPVTFRWEQWRAWQMHQLAYHAGRVGESAPPLLEGPGDPAPMAWPTRVPLLDLLPNGQGNLDQIVLGVTVEAGRLQPVAAALEKMVHVAVGGASGWGKSEFLRAIAFQIATAPQAVEIALIDLEAATFSPFARSERLRYPIADAEPEMLAILADLGEEIERRKALFKPFPTVDKLSTYNQLVDEPLPVIVLLIDEATVLLSENRELEKALRTHVLRARKYGIYAIAGGQSWKASDFDTAIRGQFSTTVHFQAKDKASSRVLLGDPAAAELDQIGRAYAIIPGRKLIQIQGPALSLRSVCSALPARSEPPMMPPAPEPEPTELEQEILAMAAEGQSMSAIARVKLGGDGGNQLKRVREILEKFEADRSP